MFAGKERFRHKEYEKAGTHFLIAWQQYKNVESLAYLVSAMYRTGDLDRAEALIENAQHITQDYAYSLRIVAHDALIKLKRDPANGCKALMGYVAFYRHHYPLMTINDVAAACTQGVLTMDMEQLESLIENQLQWHEQEVEQYLTTGTGFYDSLYGSERD